MLPAVFVKQNTKVGPAGRHADPIIAVWLFILPNTAIPVFIPFYGLFGLKE